MHILYIHQHFALPQGSTGTRSYEFARRWVSAGHKVTVICGYYDIGGMETGKGLIKRHHIEGVEIIAVGIKYSNKQSFYKRVLSFLMFMILSVIVGLKAKSVDLVYATSTPLTVGIPAIIIKFFKRACFVFEVRDQWPEIPIEMGIIKSTLLIRSLRWLEKRIYRSSLAIVALSPGMRDGIKKVIGDDIPIMVIPNSSDTEFFKPDVDGSEIRRKYNWSEKLVLLHFGAMGRANGLSFIVEVAKILADRNDVRFVLLGDGAERTKLVEQVRGLGLQNVEFLPARPKTEMPAYVAACDVSIVIFANYPVLESNSSNKFFDSLSAGKCVLLNYSGWQREVLEGKEAGFGISQYDVKEFVEKVLYLNSNRHEVRRMGQNARQLAEEMFSRDKMAADLLELFEDCRVGRFN